MDRTALVRAMGPLAVVVAFGGVLGGIFASPSFSFAENALSELGVASSAVGTPMTAVLFNGGLLVGGVLGLGFAWSLLTVARDVLGRLRGWSFGVTTWSMAGVGVFPMGDPFHVPVALAFFLGITATLAVAGLAERRHGRSRLGTPSLAGAAAHVLGWLAWVAAGGPAVVGLAVPELWGAGLLAAWVLATARRLRPRPSGQ